MKDNKTSAIRCAYLDLVGVLEAFDNDDPWLVDRKAIALTLDELWKAFPEELNGVEQP